MMGMPTATCSMASMHDTAAITGNGSAVVAHNFITLHLLQIRETLRPACMGLD